VGPQPNSAITSQDIQIFLIIMLPARFYRFREWL